VRACVLLQRLLRVRRACFMPVAYYDSNNNPTTFDCGPTAVTAKFARAVLCVCACIYISYRNDESSRTRRSGGGPEGVNDDISSV